MRRFVLVVAFLLMGCAAPGPSPSVYANWSGPRVRIANPVQRYQLPNGLDVILNRDVRLPVVALSLVYNVGSKDDPAEQTGIAHLFEHLMFQGSRHVGEDMFMRYLERAGARSVNGHTEPERTVYSETVPSSQLELALWLESDRMGFVMDHVGPATLDIQRQVVENEERERYENAPYGDVGRLIAARLFPDGHPYHARTGVSHDLGRITPADLRQFYETYYRPNNATLFLCGNFDVDQVKRQVEKYFGPIAKGAPLPRTRARELAAVEKGARLEVAADVPVPRVILTWLTPRFGEEGDADLDIIAQMMTRGDLTWRLVQDRQLAASVTAVQASRRLASVFEIVITARPGVSTDAILGATNEALDKLRTTEQSPSFIRSMTFPMMLRLASMHENPTTRVTQMATDYLTSGDPSFVDRDVARYERVSPTSIRQTAERFLPADQQLVTVVTPQHGAPVAGWLALRSDPARLAPNQPSHLAAHAESPSIGVTPDAEFRQHPPVGTIEAPFVPPTARETMLENGLRIALIEDHRIPVVSLTLALPRGTANASPAVASLAIQGLFAGTSSRNRGQISRALALAGAVTSQRLAPDSLSLNVTTLSFGTPDALVVLADLVGHATLPNVELERNRAREIALLRARSSETILSEHVARVLFPAGHPYAIDVAGDEASIRGARREDLVAFLRANVQPDKAVLAVAGDVTWDDLLKFAQRSLGTWQGTAVPDAPATLVVSPAPSGAIVILDQTGATQSEIRVAAIGPPRDSPDRLAFALLTAVVGGGINSRLAVNLRETHGYSYSPRSNVWFLRNAGIFTARASVAREHTNESLQQITGELAHLRTEDLSEGELELARLSLLRNLPDTYASPKAATTTMANLAIEHRSLDENTRLAAELAKIGATRIRQVAQQYLAPERLHVLLMGDGTVLREQLRGSPVEVRPIQTPHPEEDTAGGVSASR